MTDRTSASGGLGKETTVLADTTKTLALNQPARQPLLVNVEVLSANGDHPPNASGFHHVPVQSRTISSDVSGKLPGARMGICLSESRVASAEARIVTVAWPIPQRLHPPAIASDRMDRLPLSIRLLRRRVNKLPVLNRPASRRDPSRDLHRPDDLNPASDSAHSSRRVFQGRVPAVSDVPARQTAEAPTQGIP